MYHVKTEDGLFFTRIFFFRFTLCGPKYCHPVKLLCEPLCFDLILKGD